MKNSKKYSCDVIIKPSSKKYSESIRQFQGCPTIAITKKGRIFLGWYAGGTREPHIENYNLLIYSDDLGKTWSDPLIIIPSNKEKLIHALDIQLWTDPDGKLHVFWVQNQVKSAPEIEPEPSSILPAICVDGIIFDDFEHAEWEMICYDPDSETPEFSKPRYLYHGFLRCKPLVLNNGNWFCCNYDQLDNRYGYSISCDKGMTYTYYYGAEKIETAIDEPMAYQLSDGSIRMLARSHEQELAETYSFDNGRSWQNADLSGIDNPDTRVFISRTPSGRIILVNNDHRTSRENMTVYLSEDDGLTWKYKRCIDTRQSISYPDVDFFEDRIFLTYDRERTGAKEILFCEFTENDIIDKSHPINIKIVSKPMKN